MYLGNINYLTKALNNVNSNRNINNYKVFVLFWYINFIGRKYQLLFLQFFCLCFIVFVFFFRFWHMIWSVIWCPVSNSKCMQLDYSYNTNIKHKTISLITLNFKLLFFKIAYTCQNHSRMTMFSLISQ